MYVTWRTSGRRRNKKPLVMCRYSPESLNEFKFTHKSDVWSYGVTVWEVFSQGETPKKDLQKFITGAKSVQEACKKVVE